MACEYAVGGYIRLTPRKTESLRHCCVFCQVPHYILYPTKFTWNFTCYWRVLSDNTQAQQGKPSAICAADKGIIW